MNISVYTAPEIRSKFNVSPDPEQTGVYPIGVMLYEGLFGEPLTRPNPRLLKHQFAKCYKTPIDDNITEELTSVLIDILSNSLHIDASYRFKYNDLYIALNKAIKLAE